MLSNQTLSLTGSEAPSKLYARIQSIAIDGLRDVESFKQRWLDEDTQALWQRTLSEPPMQGSDIWRVKYASLLKESQAEKQRLLLEVKIPATDSRGFKDILQDARERYPYMKLESQDSTEFTPVNVKIAGLVFQIVSSEDSNPKQYEVQNQEKSQLTQLKDGILRHLNQRRAKGNLGNLLVCMSCSRFG